MGWKSALIYPFARKITADIKKWSANAIQTQDQILKSLVLKAQNTQFGKDHSFSGIKTYEDFKAKVPIRDYEDLKPYIEKIKTGELDVLWPGKPMYFAKTSGTTSGVKYIPLTKDSLPNHFGNARNALFNYYGLTGKGQFFDGKIIFLSGSPEMEELGGILTGRLSGIVNHQVPTWLRSNQLPSYKTNCMEDWEEKLELIVTETMNQDMRLISGIPPWVQMYYERLLERTGKKHIKDLFPNYSMFVYGGVNFEPYRTSLEELVGKKMDSVETYPASEGFIAFQDNPADKSLLMNTNSGIFFEFIPVNEIANVNPTRFSIGQIEKGVNYVVIINNNAGLWGYNIGDTVEFVSLNPFKILVTGRVKHYISAFGEHVIGKEVEEALLRASDQIKTKVVEFTVAPQINAPDGGKAFHEWFIEFDS
ncbi:MAG TPA: GH3 auxin-responsive promoter family protein, partial [Saprospiraceae bacterium]|nr:GH3 auxin-responsive promoter family protein [Saprospiraceae bacterium]